MELKVPTVPIVLPDEWSVPALPIPKGNTYYVATNGNDANPGTITQPFARLSKAVFLMKAGDVIYVRGGTYSNETTVINLYKVGNEAARYNIWAYPGEKPVFDLNYKSYFHIKGSYWYIKGLEIYHSNKNGMRIGDQQAPGGGTYNIIENCVFHDNRDAGLMIGLAKGTAVNTDGLRAAYNWIINCDSYLNFDPNGSTGIGGNADGFACKLNPGKGNVFDGCRSWENSDDGWDLYMANFGVILQNCWTWHNGDPNSQYSDSYVGTWEGNGQGFKLGGGDAAKPNEFVSRGAHVLRNCIAFNTRYGKASSKFRAFDRNNNMAGVTMINCLAFDSMVGFYFDKQPDNGTQHILINCVAFGCAIKNNQLSGDTLQFNNNWNLAGTDAGRSDFTNLSETLAKAPRSTDGSLPTGFARLVAGSGLIDRGANAGGKWRGLAPDLGAVESF